VQLVIAEKSPHDLVGFRFQRNRRPTSSFIPPALFFRMMSHLWWGAPRRIFLSPVALFFLERFYQLLLIFVCLLFPHFYFSLAPPCDLSSAAMKPIVHWHFADPRWPNFGNIPPLVRSPSHGLVGRVRRVRSDTPFLFRYLFFPCFGNPLSLGRPMTTRFYISSVSYGYGLVQGPFSQISRFVEQFPFGDAAPAPGSGLSPFSNPGLFSLACLIRQLQEVDAFVDLLVSLLLPFLSVNPHFCPFRLKLRFLAVPFLEPPLIRN